MSLRHLVLSEGGACCQPSTSSALDLTPIVDALCASDRVPLRHERRSPCAVPLPSTAAVAEIVEDVRSVLFPGYFDSHESSARNLRFHIGHTLDRVRLALQDQVTRGICFACDGNRPTRDCADQAQRITDAFIARIPDIQALLMGDAQAAYEGDPAATSPDEAIFCYPGLRAITEYRIAHELHVLGVPILPRVITEHAHSTTGIDIHPGAAIGKHFFIDHGTGVVIGETCVIGDRVRIYQGVTLGAKSFPLDENGKPIKGIARHPILEDEVIIYSGATILGRVTIGRGSVIGGNVWLTRSVPAGSRVQQQQPRQETFLDGGGI